MSRRTAVAGICVLIVLSACGPSSTKPVLSEGGEDSLMLSAQAVPDATMLPCVAALPVGWSFAGFSATTGSVRFWMDSGAAGVHALEVELSEDCDTSDAVEVEPGPDGVRRFEQPLTQEPELSGYRYSRFTGGCVTLRYDFRRGTGAAQLDEIANSVMLVPRSALVRALEENRDLLLCGAGAPPCAGASD